MSTFWTVQVAAFALIAVDMAIRAVRVRLLLPAAERPGFTAALVANAYGEAASAVTPARAGGEPARFLELRRLGVPAAPVVVALAVEKLLDWLLIPVVLIALATVAGQEGVLSAIPERVDSIDVRAWLPWIVVVLVLMGASVLLARRFPGLRDSAGRSLREIWTSARALSAGAWTRTTALTLTSIAARTAVLPVLVLPHYPGLSASAVVLGSFVLLYSQLVLPTPAGAGGVELGFVAGFAATLDPGEIAELLVLWRAYTLGIGAIVGGAFFAVRVTTRRRAAETLRTPPAPRSGGMES